MKIICRNRESGRQSTFKSIKGILREINRDRSAEWTPYDETDWQEGLQEFTEFDLIKII